MVRVEVGKTSEALRVFLPQVAKQAVPCVICSQANETMSFVVEVTESKSTKSMNGRLMCDCLAMFVEDLPTGGADKSQMGGWRWWWDGILIDSNLKI